MSLNLSDYVRPFLRSSLTGGGSTALDGIATVNLTVPVNGLVCVGGIAYLYQLVTSTAATSSPNLIRPVDYNAGTNTKVWTLQSLSIAAGIAVGGDLSGSLPNPTVAKIQGNAVLAGAPSQNQQYVWNAANSDFELIHKVELQFCRAVAVANVASLSGTTTVDGIALAAGDRVLLTAQSTGSQNGLWTVQAGGWTRPITYAAAQVVVQGSWCTISGGTVYANSSWQLVATASVTVDTTATTWAQLFPLASTTTSGLVKLAQDLAGTGLLPVVKAASQDFALSGQITAAFSTDQNDWAPTGVSTCTSILITASGIGNRTLTGLAGGAKGRLVLLVNVSAKQITLSNANAGSIAANRFGFAGGDVILTGVGYAALLAYDSTNSLWRLAQCAAASSTGIGGIILAGHLGGTAEAPTVTGVDTLSVPVTNTSPSAGTVNNGAWGSSGILRINTAAGDVTLTGLASVAGGKVVIVTNIGANKLTISNLDAGSTAANQFSLGGNVVLTSNQSLICWYDSTSSLWRAGIGDSIFFAQGGTVAGATTFSARLTLSGPVTNTPLAVTFASTTNVDFNSSPVQTITVTGALTITTSNLAAGAMQKLYLIDDGAGPHVLTFPGWKIFGTALPAQTTLSKTIIVSLESTGTTDANVYATALNQV